MLNDLKILYAEDEDYIRENVVEALHFMAADVIAVENGQEAYDTFLQTKPDIIILDIEMPHLDGLQVAQKIRQKDKEVQIIIATAYTNTNYFLKAVELNLTKYLLKPITLIDLKNALTKCLANMKSKASPLQYFQNGDYYDLSKHLLFINNEETRLDFHERELLELLIQNRTRVVTYEEIEGNIWEYGMSSAALRSLVRNLRQKVPKNSIQNISKMGYKIVLKD